MKTRRIWVAGCCLAALTVAGCVTTQDRPAETAAQPAMVAEASSADAMALEQRLAAKEREAMALQGSVQELERRLKESESSQAMVPAMLDAPLLPPNARPGECYARLYIPPETKTEQQTLLKKEAAEKVSTEPARFEWVEERVLVKEATEVVEVIPARYDWKEERILVKEASSRLEPVAAAYRTETERVMVTPARSYWKKGNGPIEKVDNSTGEIMCLIEEPAVYKTVEKRVVDRPAGVREVPIPAEYQTVRQRVVVEPARTVTRTIPAEYETVKVRKVVEPAKEMRTEIPAEYETLTNTVQVSPGRLEWRPILCETNTTVDVVRKLQLALQARGYDPVRIDGILGWYTMQAVRKYQKDHSMAEGQLTIETLRSLGVL